MYHFCDVIWLGKAEFVVEVISVQSWLYQRKMALMRSACYDEGQE